MAKKAAITLDLPDIKLAEGKTKKAAKPEQLEISSPILDKNGALVKKATADTENVVDKAIKLSRQIENLEVELTDYEKVLKETADTAKTESCNNGDFVKTVNIAGTSERIQIQFRDAYSKMDASMETPLKSIFGDKYPIMFDKSIVHSVRPEKLDELKQVLGDRFEIFFNTDTSIKPTKDFQYNHFMLKKSLKPEQTATVQKVLDACQSSPAVKYPK